MFDPQLQLQIQLQLEVEFLILQDDIACHGHNRNSICSKVSLVGTYLYISQLLFYPINHILQQNVGIVLHKMYWQYIVFMLCANF